MASTQSEIKAFLESRAEAMRTKDLDRLMPHYSRDIVYFDVVPPLQYAGSAALRARFSEWFAAYQSGIRQDIHDLRIVAGGDIAVAFMLIRSGGTLKNGQEVALSVRATSSCQRSNGTWLITHEHVSVPADLKSGRAVTDLVP